MKKMFMFYVTSLFLLLLSFGFNACTQANNIEAPLVQTNGSEDSFEEALVFGLENLAENQTIDIFWKNGKIDWNPSRNTSTITLRKHDCSGNAISVAKCSKAIIDRGGCITAGSDRDNKGNITGYWADEVKCPN